MGTLDYIELRPVSFFYMRCVMRMEDMKSGLAFLLVLFAATITRAEQTPQELADRVKSILTNNCYDCHGKNGTAAGGIAYISALDRLIDRGAVIPGKPATSPLYMKLSTGHRVVIAKEADGVRTFHKPADSEIELICQWIQLGAPIDVATVASGPRAFIPRSSVLESIRTDLAGADRDTAQNRRYFTLTHLYNAGYTDGELQTFRAGLSNLLNSPEAGAQHATVVYVDPRKTILRIDLRECNMTADGWEHMLASYPYQDTHNSREAVADPADHTALALHTVRADWFIFAASCDTAWHGLLGLPRTPEARNKLLQATRRKTADAATAFDPVVLASLQYQEDLAPPLVAAELGYRLEEYRKIEPGLHTPDAAVARLTLEQSYELIPPPSGRSGMRPDDLRIGPDDLPQGIPYPGLGDDLSRRSLKEDDLKPRTPDWAKKKDLNGAITDTVKEPNDDTAIIRVGPGGNGRTNRDDTGRAKPGEAPLAPFGVPGGGANGLNGPVFGASGNARRIVFVCDASGSMINKMATLKDQLTKAYTSLKPIESFELIFFKDEKFDSFMKFYHKDGLVAATPEAKRKAAEFLQGVTTTGSTDPIPGIIAAFKTNPQVMYLLTDGDFPDNDAVLQKVRELNNARPADNKVKINTIAFVGDGDNEVAFLDLLKTIAKESGGTFKHVKESEVQ
jgi:hypothetical protein